MKFYRVKTISQSYGSYTNATHFNYLKHGDHATNLISSINYFKNGVSDGRITYTYDNMGNIVSVNENGKQVKKYEYDSICRLIKETNIDTNKEICYTYDTNGNILTKTVNGEEIEYKYEFGTDKLVSVGNEPCVYDVIGNPTTYRGDTCVWENGRQLKSITDGTNTVSFTYNGKGLRTSKTANGETRNYVYENGKILRQETNGNVLDFIYGSNGLIGFKYNSATYLYRKNVFGDIIAIYTQASVLVAKYSYTAFGSCEIKLDTDGIATLNPIRYRGYYYDTETGLYYLKSRYYDPEIGRFITIDDISYINPETINGLNLYAYCGNNPVMNVDPNGNAWWEWVVGGLIIVGLGIATAFTGGVAGVILGAAFYGAVTGAVGGALVSGVIGGISSSVSGNGFWSGFIDGAADGFISGAIIGGVTGALSAGINIATGAIKIVGSAQKTGTFFHRMASNIQAGKMAMQIGRYSQITLDRSLNKAGLVGRKMPDVVGTARFGKNLAVEVVSKSQTAMQMRNKLVAIQAYNPNLAIKVIKWAGWFGRWLF